MTSDVNYKIIKRIETETAKEIKKEKVTNETLAKTKKEKAIAKRKAKQHVIQKIKANPKL